LVDLSITVATVVRLNNRLSQIDEVSARLRQFSNELGSAVAEGVLAVKATDTLVCEQLVTTREHAQQALHAAGENAHEELAARYRELSERLGLGQRRILQAFPNLRSLRSPTSLQALQQKLSHLRESRKQR